MKIADLQIDVRDGVVIATVAGEIDMSNADELRTALESHITNDALGLVIDLSGVRYVDSVGIQLLYELRQRLSTRGQKLALAVPPGSAAEKTLRLVNAVEYLGMVDDPDKAAAAVNGT